MTDEVKQEILLNSEGMVVLARRNLRNAEATLRAAESALAEANVALDNAKANHAKIQGALRQEAQE